MTKVNKNIPKSATKSIEDVVNGFKTKHKRGFTKNEIRELLKDYPNINMDKFNSALMGCTGMLIDGEFITYHCDIITALRCGIENRDMYFWEWD